MKTVLVDMDQTLNRLWETYTVYYNLYSGTAQPEHLTREQMKIYSVSENFSNPWFKNASKEEIHKINTKVFSKKGFWREIPVLDDFVYEEFRKLYQAYDVYVCTVPFKGYDHCAAEKIQWMRKHFPFFDTSKMIFLRNKNLVKADLLIDDAPEHLEAFSGSKIAVDYPFNRHLDLPRVKNWSEVFQTVKNIFKE